MKTYIVSSDNSLSPVNLKFNQYTRKAAIEMLKKAQEEFRSLIENFAAQHPGQVIVGEGAWINGTIKVETTPALAEKLKKVKGVGDVSEPRPISFETTDKPAEPQPRQRRLVL